MYSRYSRSAFLTLIPAISISGMSIAALITAGISRSKTPYGVPNSKAKVGMITGIIGIILSVIWLILYVALIVEVVDSYGDYYSYGYYNDWY